MSVDPIEAAKTRGEAAVAAVCRIVDANEPEAATISRLEALVRHGYKFIDIKVRKDGQETWFEGDWLARLFREEIR